MLASAFPSQISHCQSLAKLFVVAEDSYVHSSVCGSRQMSVVFCGSPSARNRAAALDYLSFSMTLPKRWLPAFDTESTAFSATLFFFATGSRSDGFRNGGAVDVG